MAAKPKPRHSVTQPSDSSYKIIALTKNQNAIVDAADFDWLNQYNWQAHWSQTGNGFYAARTARHPVTGKRIYVSMHRFILGCKASKDVDHRNGDRLDNRRGNLRRCTHPQNMRNRGRNANNKSGYKGVCWHRISTKWCAQINHAGKVKHLGLFLTPEEAAKAYDAAAKRWHGKFAYSNFPTAHAVDRLS